MTADERIDAIHEKLRNSLKIITNVMTPEGRKVSIAWIHKPNPVPFVPMEDTRCLVTGSNLEEALRKVECLEQDFFEMEHPGVSQE